MDGSIISWNRDSTRIFGYEPVEVLGQSVTTLYPPEEHERLLNEVIRPLQEQGELEIETIAWNNAGQRFPLALSLSLLRDESGTPIGMIGYSIDISERRTMQRTVQASQERLQLVLDATNDGIWDWHIPSGEVYYSPRWMGMLGYAPGELAGTLQTWQDLLHPDDQVSAIQTVDAHLKKQSPSFELEFRMRTKAGEWVWIMARGKVVAHDAQGQPVRMLGTHTDISERKQQEAALQQSHAILHTVMDSIDSLIYVADMETYELLYLNKTGVGVFGEIGGRTCWQVLQENQAGPCAFCTNAHLVDEQGNPKEPYQWEFQNTANGRWYHVYDRAIQWVDGRIVRLEIATDIHDLKRQEAELRIFKALVENAPDGVCLASPVEFRLTYANSAYREMVHYDDELIGMYGHDLVSIDGAQFQQIGEHIMNHGSWQGTLPCRRKDGSIVPTTQSIFLMRDQQGDVQAMAVIARDITGQQQAEAERAALQQQVIEAQREALRELSTPLIPIAENVVIMPLIGTIDSQRAQMIMEALLEGIAHHQADLAILDITGVAVVDTQVAQALIQAAQAVKLLGARVMLTGIQPQIAQTLVHLGTDLGGILTRGNLQSGIAAALTKA
jgi:PAS domain S-box-containing protein